MSSRGESDGEGEDDGGTAGGIRRAAVRTRVLCSMPRRQSCLLGCVLEAASAVCTPNQLAFVGLHVTSLVAGSGRRKRSPFRSSASARVCYALMLLTALVRTRDLCLRSNFVCIYCR